MIITGGSLEESKEALALAKEHSGYIWHVRPQRFSSSFQTFTLRSAVILLVQMSLTRTRMVRMLITMHWMNSSERTYLVLVEL